VYKTGHFVCGVYETGFHKLIRLFLMYIKHTVTDVYKTGHSVCGVYKTGHTVCDVYTTGGCAANPALLTSSVATK
jgi:hypothetical protein